MNTIYDEIDNLKRLIKMIAAQFGGKCEVILHDLTKGYEHTIVAIENGNITNRKIGDCGSNIGLGVLSGKIESDDMYNYTTELKDGKLLRSSTSYIKDVDNNVIGAICINFDVTELLYIDDILKKVLLIEKKENTRKTTEIFANDVNDLMDYFISECKEVINKPVSLMTKEDKIKIVEFLDSKGVFLITKSGDRVCEFLNISKYTLYNYLDIARKNLS